MQFFGRTKEIGILRNIRTRADKAAQFTVVTGRRRVGKTELIRQTFADGDPFLYFFVARRSEKELCSSFQEEIQQKLGIFLPGEQNRFRDIFKWILTHSCDHPLTLVIDEFQDFKRCDPAIFSEMQRDWDEFQSRAKINLVVCGSANTLMNRIFRDDKEPLFGRPSAFLKVRPLPVSALKEILRAHNPDFTASDLLSLYAITGGVAKYVAVLMDSGAVTTDRMIDALAGDGSIFVDEGKNALIEEFGKDYGIYFSILSAIARGLTERGQIENAVGAGALGGYLQRLEKDYEIVARRQPLFAKTLAKNLRYAIGDNFYNLWFRFIAGHSAAVELGAFDQLRALIRRDWSVFCGFALERYFTAQLAETGRYTRLGGWWDRKGENEIDLIAESELDRTATFFEIKMDLQRYSPAELARKRDTFLRATGAYDGWKCDCRALSLANV